MIIVAEKKTKPKSEEPKPKAQEKEKPKAQAAQKEPKSGFDSRIILALAVIIVIAIIAILVLYPSAIISGVPFSTFKSDLQSSPRVSLTATYTNQSQYANESTCFTSMIQVLSHTRQPSTIDFFIINKATNVCTYSTTGLGGSVNPTTTNASYCLSQAYGEDGIFLNYSTANYTTITPSRMYIYGNDAYLQKCPIAIELS